MKDLASSARSILYTVCIPNISVCCCRGTRGNALKSLTHKMSCLKLRDAGVDVWSGDRTTMQGCLIGSLFWASPMEVRERGAARDPGLISDARGHWLAS